MMRANGRWRPSQRTAAARRPPARDALAHEAQRREGERLRAEASALAANPTELDNLAASRMARQALLTRATTPQFLAVIDEGALRRPVGEPGVLRRQLQHLVSVAEWPNVTLRVVPLASGAYAGLQGPFVILEFDGEASLVFVENQGTGLFLEEEADLAGYRLALGNILHAALALPATADLLAALVAESPS